MRPLPKLLLTSIIAAAVSVGLLFVGDRLTVRPENEAEDKPAQVFSEWLSAETFTRITAVSGNITEAWSATDVGGHTVGYGVTVRVRGYVDTIDVYVAFSASGNTVRGVSIGKHRETPDIGARVAESSFTDRFTAKRTPFILRTEETEALRDGKYRAAESAYDATGFRNVVELTVVNGEISAVNWDGEAENGGRSKKELSRDGEYVMSADGLPWHEQAEVMERALLERQNPTAIVYDEDSGKTDAYSGATIDVSPFVRLAAEALGQSRRSSGTLIDGISGATVSSKAVIAAVNEAASFVGKIAQ